MTATLACPQGCGWTTTARTQPIAAYALRRHQGDPPARLTTAARRVAPPAVHEALGLVEYVGHDAPKGRERIRRTEDWTSLDVDAVPMIHPNTVGLT